MKMILFACALTVFAGFNFVGLTRDEDKIRQELEAVYAKIDAALKAKDLKILDSLLSDNYEGLGEESTFTKEETLASIKRNFEMAKEITFAQTTIDGIRRVGKNEIVDYTQTVKAVIDGGDRRNHSLEIVAKGRNWWIKEKNRWVCVAGEEIGTDVKIDGKAVSE